MFLATKFRIYGKFLSVFLIFLGSMGFCNAASFVENTTRVMDEHARVIAAKAAADSLREAVQVTRKEWFPSLSISAFKGKELRYNPSGTNDTRNLAHDLNLTLTQPLYDFGGRSNRTKIARMRLDQAKKTIELVKQSLLLEAISAQVNLKTSAKIVKYASTSVSNIKRQAQLENARVRKGAGLSTDVLQAKVQLAGAENRYNQSVSALKASRNRYRAVFGEFAVNETKLEDITIPVGSIPDDIETVVSRSLSGNLQLQSLQINKDISKKEISVAYSDQFGPKFDIVAERKYKNDLAGVSGKAREDILKIQFNFDLNIGFSSLNNLKASKFNYVASDNQLLDARDVVAESARNAYDQYQTAALNSKVLENQANISSEFLKLARKERKLGKRSLIDVLSGETAEINAKSDAAAAKAQLVIAAYTILSVIGELELTAVKLR